MADYFKSINFKNQFGVIYKELALLIVNLNITHISMTGILVIKIK